MRSRLFTLAFLALAALLGSGRASAATYRVPADDDLVRKAKVIVRGVVEEVTSLADAEGAIHTDVTVSVSNVLKGSGIGARVVVRQPGGTVGENTEVYPGIGTFTRGEDVLLMLEPLRDGIFRLTDFALGKFHVGRAADGSEFLRRDGLADAHLLGSAAGALASAPLSGAAALADPDRDAASFQRFITDVVAGRPAAGGYALPSLQAESGASINFVLLVDPNDPSMSPSRWNQFDVEGKVVYRDNAAGDKGSMCVKGCHPQVAAGVADWNGTSGAQIHVVYGGTDSTVGKKCFQKLVNQIQFGDPCNELTDLASCTGTLAVGGFASTATGGTSVGCAPLAQTFAFNKITRVAILVNNGAGDCLDACDYEDLIAHESGHTLGSGHSFDSSALMAPFLVHGRCGALQSDDVNFAKCAYPCRPPEITSVTPKIVSGVLKAIVIGTGFRSHVTVEIDAGGGFAAAPRTSFRTQTKIVGQNVASIWPAGAPVMVRAVNSAGCPSNAISVAR